MKARLKGLFTSKEGSRGGHSEAIVGLEEGNSSVCSFAGGAEVTEASVVCVSAS